MGLGSLALAEAIPGGFQEEAALMLGLAECVGFKSVEGMAGRGRGASKGKEVGEWSR